MHTQDHAGRHSSPTSCSSKRGPANQKQGGRQTSYSRHRSWQMSSRICSCSCGRAGSRENEQRRLQLRRKVAGRGPHISPQESRPFQDAKQAMRIPPYIWIYGPKLLPNITKYLLKSLHTKQPILGNVLKARYGQLWNKNMAYVQKTPFIRGLRSANSNASHLCSLEDCDSHLLGGQELHCTTQ